MERMVRGINRSWDTEYDARCASCWLGHSHTWTTHIEAIHGFVLDQPYHLCGKFLACPTEVRIVEVVS